MTKPTPTPWTIHPDGEIISERTNHNNLNPVAVDSGACTPADANLIVQAVNAYEPMRAALKSLLAHHRVASTTSDTLQDRIAEARAALTD